MRRNNRERHAKAARNRARARARDRQLAEAWLPGEQAEEWAAYLSARSGRQVANAAPGRQEPGGRSLGV
jgi:hypothetical protein